jgi:hypothetical protein
MINPRQLEKGTAMFACSHFILPLKMKGEDEQKMNGIRLLWKA